MRRIKSAKFEGSGAATGLGIEGTGGLILARRSATFKGGALVGGKMAGIAGCRGDCVLSGGTDVEGT
jgi:hypothetical protein